MSQADFPNTMNPSRRTVLAGISVAVAPAIAAVDKSLGAVALGADPIFAVIQAHHESMAHEVACNKAIYRLEEALPEDRQTWSLFHDSEDQWTPPEGCADAPEWIDAQRNMREAYDLRFDAIETLLTTGPSTLAGAVALLEYVGSPELPTERGKNPILFSVIHLNDERIPRAVRTFPTRLAATMRSLIAAG